jgi:hypothetical protein
MLTYLILGGVLTVFGVPILGAITELALGIIELLKAKVSVSIVKC